MRPGGALGAIVGLAVVSLCLLPCAGASGTSPVGFPAVSGGLAQQAATLAVNASTGAYVQSFSFNYTVVPATSAIDCPSTPPGMRQSCLGPVTMNLTQNVTGISATGSTWVNVTNATFWGESNCAGTTYCAVTYACGSASQTFAAPPIAYRFASTCPAFRLNWTNAGSSLAFFGLLPLPQPLADAGLSVTRTVTTVASEHLGWAAASGSREQTLANVTFLGPSWVGATTRIYNNSANFCNGVAAHHGYCPSATTTGSPVLVTPPDLAWWVPYPSGEWDTTRTAVTELDTNTVLPPSNYTVTQTAVLLEWSGFPTAAANVTEHFLFSMYSLIPLGTSGTPPGEVVLGMGNVTSGSTYDTASVTWQNTANGNFTGVIYLEGSWLATASGISVYANGAAIPSYELSVTTSSITVQPGYVPVAPQATVTFVAHFTASPYWSFTQPIVVLGGIALSAGSFVLLGGLGMAAVVVWRKAVAPKETGLVTGLVGVTVMVLFVLALVVL